MRCEDSLVHRALLVCSLETIEVHSTRCSIMNLFPRRVEDEALCSAGNELAFFCTVVRATFAASTIYNCGHAATLKGPRESQGGAPGNSLLLLRRHGQRGSRCEKLSALSALISFDKARL